MTPETLVMFKWGALLLTVLAFAGFAYTLISSLGSSATTYTESMSEETARRFEDIFLFIPARRIAHIGRSAAAAVFLLCFIPLFDYNNPISTISGIALGAVFGGMALMAPYRLVEVMRLKRRQKFNLQLVDALGSMSNALRAGFSLNQAFDSVVQSGEKPIAQEFEVMLQQTRVGMSFQEALQSLEQRVGSDDLTLVVSAIDIARRTGGNLTEIFDKISETIRERIRIERRVMTLTAQGRLQGIIVALMPILLGAAMTFVKPDMMLPFFRSAGGMAAIGITAVLIVLGWLVIRKIIRIDV